MSSSSWLKGVVASPSEKLAPPQLPATFREEATFENRGIAACVFCGKKQRKKLKN